MMCDREEYMICKHHQLPTSIFKVGSNVKLKTGAKTYAGDECVKTHTETGIASFAFNDTWIINSIRGDCVIIDKNTSGTISIYTPVNINDLIIVE